MIQLRTRPCMLIAGMLSVLTGGCITGTNTFSSATVPVTRYCSIEDTPTPVFDFPATEKRSQLLHDIHASDGTGGKVSLAP